MIIIIHNTKGLLLSINVGPQVLRALGLNVEMSKQL